MRDRAARRALVVGADAARGGWAIVALEASRVAEVTVMASLAEVLTRYPSAKTIGIDIPIGMPELQPRAADLAARTFVGPRRSAVFPTFPRQVLEAPSHAAALELARNLWGAGISKQSYGLRRRILEVDEPARRDARIVEVHPEVSFRELAGRPLPSKRTREGSTIRRRLLASAGIAVPERVLGAAADDLLDAAVVAWSADRYARGAALPLPEGATERIGPIWR